MHIPLETSNAMDTPKDVPIMLDIPLPLSSLGELNETRECESDANVHNNKCDDW